MTLMYISRYVVDCSMIIHIYTPFFSIHPISRLILTTFCCILLLPHLEINQKLITVGIQLLLNDPPERINGPRLNRKGKLFLKFGKTQSSTSHDHGKKTTTAYDHPQLVWTDGYDVSYTIELFDIQSIRQPMLNETEEEYPILMEELSFFVTTYGGTSLLFEAGDEMELIRVVVALKGIVGRLVKKIVMVREL